jgi:hypothetical protein
MPFRFEHLKGINIINTFFCLAIINKKYYLCKIKV